MRKYIVINKPCFEYDKAKYVEDLNVYRSRIADYYALPWITRVFSKKPKTPKAESRRA